MEPKNKQTLFGNFKLNLKRYEEQSIKDLGLVYAFTHSESLQLGCSRLYGYDYIESFETNYLNTNFAYGSCWHKVLEELLLLIKEKDKMLSSDFVHKYLNNNLKRIIEEYFEEINFPDKNSVQYFDFISKVQRVSKEIFNKIKLSIDGWLQHWEKNIHPRYKVISVEKIVFAPCEFNDQIFNDEVFVVKKTINNKTFIRPSRIGESFNREPDCDFGSINMKFYKVGKIDALVQNRENESLWIVDHKTSKYISGYERKADFNLQLVGYCALLRDMIKRGVFGKKDMVVGGVIWDLCSSAISELPKPLKSGKMSTTKKPPSWLFIKSLKVNNIDFHEYREFIKELKETDCKYFSFVEKMVTDSEMNRCMAENYSTAKQISSLRKESAFLNLNEKGLIDVFLPRYTLCTQYNSCKFSQICLNNNNIYDIMIARSTKIFWEA